MYVSTITLQKHAFCPQHALICFISGWPTSAHGKATYFFSRTCGYRHWKGEDWINYNAVIYKRCAVLKLMSYSFCLLIKFHIMFCSPTILCWLNCITERSLVTAGRKYFPRGPHVGYCRCFYDVQMFQASAYYFPYDGPHNKSHNVLCEVGTKLLK